MRFSRRVQRQLFKSVLIGIAGWISFTSPAQSGLLDLSSFQHGEIITNFVTSNGTINISVQNNGGGPDLPVIFDTTLTGTADPDLEGPPNSFWDGGNVASNEVLGNAIIIEENSTDGDNDGFIDSLDPDDEAGGGLIIFDLPTNAFEISFFWVDFEEDNDNFVVFTDGVTTQTIEFTEFSDPNSPFFTADLGLGDNFANEFVPLNVSDLTSLSSFNRFWFDLVGSGAINNIGVFFGDQVGNIGDFVWFDLDGDGIQDGGSEIGISNVTVELYYDRDGDGVLDPEDDLVATETTDASGLYLFEDRGPGDYLVKVTDENNELDGLILTGGTDPHSLSLSAGQDYLDADFGYFGAPMLGDLVWYDADYDGIRDAGEPGISNVTVTLYDAASNTVATTNTDSNGIYYFRDLSTAETYFVGFMLPSGFVFSPSNQGGDDTLDSDPDTVTGFSTTTTLDLTEIDLTWDAGIYALPDITKTSSVPGSTVESSETITYSITVSNGTPAAITNATIFDAIPAGTTYVNGSLTITHSPSGGSSGSNNVRDAFSAQTYTNNDGSVSWAGPWDEDGSDDGSPTAGNVLVSAGGELQTQGSGGSPTEVIQRPVDLDGVDSATLSFDWRSPGTTEPDDIITIMVVNGGTTNTLDTFNLGGAPYRLSSGSTNYNITAFASTNTVIRFESVMSTDTEDFFFDNVDVTYTATGVQTGPPPNLVTNLTIPSGEYISLEFQVTADDPLPPGLLNIENCASVILSGTSEQPEDCVTDPIDRAGLGDFVWEDLNGDGIQDPGETGIVDVVVTLLDTNSVVVGVTTTDVNGAYAFTDLVPDDYVVEFTAPAGYEFTLQNQGGDDTEDSDADAVTGLTDTITLAAGENNPTIDAGLYRPAQLGDFVWEDLNADGIQDVGEPGVTNVTVTLYDAATNSLETTTTDVNGAYAFTNLVPGTYFVEFTPPAGYLLTDLDAGGDDTLDSDADPVTGRTVPTTLVSGENDTTWDAGLVVPAAIGDRVWYDEDGNGIQDVGETSNITNLTVELLDTNGTVVASTTTDANGLYLFTDLSPDPYTVRFDLGDISTNVTISPADAGGDDGEDSDGITGDVGGNVDTAEFVLSPGETNLTVDLGITTLGSTLAAVGRVWGEDRRGKATILWTTSSEWNTAGFNLYRQSREGFPEQKINQRLVPAGFHQQGATYEQPDPDISPATSAVYRLEEVELTGKTRDLGLHAVTFEAPAPEPATLNVGSASFSVIPHSMDAAATTTATSSVLKVAVRDPGIYAVRYADIADGMGRSLAEITEWAEENRIRVTTESNPVRILHDPDNVRLLFYGLAMDRKYTRDRMYIIREGEGALMPLRPANAVQGQEVITEAWRLEEDRLPFDAARDFPEDFFYWEYIISGHPVLGERSVDIDFSGYDGGPLYLEVTLQGWSETAADPDHHADLLLNGNLLGTVTLDGQDRVTARFSCPPDWVEEGMQTLTLRGVLPDGQSHSYFVLDGYSIEMDRRLLPVNRTAHVVPGSASALAAPHLEAPVVFALDADDRPTLVEGLPPAASNQAWQVQATDARFAIRESGALPELAPAPAAEIDWFLSQDNRLDYLVITSRELKPAADALAEYRSGQGLRTGVAVFERVCDLLNDGFRSPEAVRTLIHYAAAEWEEPPWMVVLMGNGHYDYLDGLDLEPNHIPPLLQETVDGLFAADSALTDVDRDGRSDIPIGRLPAGDVEEGLAMVDKIKGYESNFNEPVLRTFAFAADQPDDAGDFPQDNLRLASGVGGSFPTLSFHAEAQDVQSSRELMKAQFTGEAGWVHYTGHGGVNHLSDLNLLTASDIEALNNAETPPVFVALSCLVGRFESPGLSSLGELLMQKSGGGAVAVIGPSGLSRNRPAVELGQALYRAIADQGEGVLGPALQQALESLPHDLFTRDTLRGYHLLGDPALRIAGQTGDSPAVQKLREWRWRQFAPSELEDDITQLSESGIPDSELLRRYAAGSPPGADPVSLFSGVRVDEEGNSVLVWRKRSRAEDLEYRIRMSRDLMESWQPASGEDVNSWVDEASGGIMENLETQIPELDEDRLFWDIETIYRP